MPNATFSAIPQLGAPQTSGRGAHVAGLAVAVMLLGATLFGYAYGAEPGPKISSFLAVCATVWAFAELLTAFLLFSQFYVAGKISFAIVATGYLFSGLLTIPYLFFFPGVFTQPGQAGDLQVSVWLWLIWHLAFPIAVATAHLIDGSLDTIGVSRSRIPRTLCAFLAGTVCAAAGVFAIVFFARNALPEIVVTGGHFSAVYRTFAVPPIIALNGMALAIVALRARRLSPLQTWLCIALLTMFLDGLLNIWSPGRYSVAWYIGKFEALIMATVVLFALLLEVAVLYRRLYDVATIDVLTGLPNRRSFMDVATTTLAKPEVRSTGIALLVVDVDHFKAYNDRYGHIAGDEALAAVASALRTSIVRNDDSVARYGGEEFVILLPNMPVNGVEAVAERVRRRVADLEIAHEAAPTGRLTVSVGIGYSSGAHEVSEPVLFELADRALYAAKDMGRDCVVLQHVLEDTVLAAGSPG